jgi:hypothetical protein
MSHLFTLLLNPPDITSGGSVEDVKADALVEDRYIYR